jgi:hypothetical protein
MCVSVHIVPIDDLAPPLAPFLSCLKLWVLAYQKVYADETSSYMPRSAIPASMLASLISLCKAILDDRFCFSKCLTAFIQSPCAAQLIGSATLSKLPLESRLLMSILHSWGEREK